MAHLSSACAWAGEEGEKEEGRKGEEPWSCVVSSCDDGNGDKEDDDDEEDDDGCDVTTDMQVVGEKARDGSGVLCSDDAEAMDI